MQDILTMIYENVERFHKLKREIEQMVAPMKNDQAFHKIAGEVIPEKFKKGSQGYEFLRMLLGDKKADELHIKDPELERMKAGEGI